VHMRSWRISRFAGVDNDNGAALPAELQTSGKTSS
jgi:hypothetical protein